MAKPPLAVDSESSKTAAHWIAEIELSEKWQAPWCERSKKIVQRYKSEPRTSDANMEQAPRRFAILWANTQTLGPAIYARKPEPVVSRRFKDADPVGRYASEVLERALKFATDQYDFDSVMAETRDDYILIARGQAWARFISDGDAVGEQITQDASNGDPQYAEVVCDHLFYGDWGMQPCRSWGEASYVWKRAYLDRRQLVKRFGTKKGRAVPLESKSDGESFQDQEIKEKRKRAAIYEIWDKTTRKVYWICKGYQELLDERDDPLKLKNFFPCPRPLMGTLGPDAYIPVPDYIFYKDQAEELDDLTGRIADLSDALRMVGAYDGSEGEILANMFAGKANELVPVPSMSRLQDKGGVGKLIEWLPIDMVIQTLSGCYDARSRLLEDIYQITGISDIIRGASDPRETAAAQGIKAQWGSLRVRDRQKDVARFARDLIEIQGEIIASKFPVATLQAMTGVQLLTAEQKQQVQALVQLGQQNPQLAQQAQQNPEQFGLPENTLDLMNLPTWDEVNALLKNDMLRAFRIDIETDSTIEPDEQADKQSAVELTTAVGQFFGNFGPAVAAQPSLAPFAGDLLKFVFRRFRAGRELEDSLERAIANLQPTPPAEQPQPAPPEPPDPAEQQAKVLTAQARMLDAQTAAQQAQQDGQYNIADLQLRSREQQIKLAALQRDPRPQSVS
jgi:hypothetical protein